MGKLGRIRRNDPNTVSFKLVAADHTNPRVQNSDKPVYIFQRSDKNRHNKAVPLDLLRVLSPDDFGIHSHLPKDKAAQLCREIYGTSTLPAEYASIDKHASDNEHESDILIDAVEIDDGDSNEDDDIPFLLDDDNARKEYEADVDDYFPNDNYNYEQHLRQTKVSAGATFIEHQSLKAAAKHVEEYEIPYEFRYGEGREILEVLEDAVDIDDADADGELVDGGLSDDFVAKAQNCSQDVVAKLLWGANVETKVKNDCVSTDEEAKFARLLELYRDEDIGELSSDEDMHEEANQEEVLYKTAAEFLEDATAKPGRRYVHYAEFRKQNIEEEEENPSQDVMAVTKRLVDELDKATDDASSSSTSSDSDSEVSGDCESVLTSRSTLFNHTSIISRPVGIQPRKLASTSITFPLDKLPPDVAALALELDEKQRQKQRNDSTTCDEDSTTISLPPIDVTRYKGETLEEKKARKSAVKGARRSIRVMKKESKNELKNCAKKESEKISNKNSYDIREGVRVVRIT